MNEERKLVNHVDEIILNASQAELLEIQKLDTDTQLEGNSFYEIYSSKRKINNKQVSPKVRSPKKF